MLRNERGITLIALVISIIVMMIIAGISINAIVGDNGIIAQAQDAKIMTELSDILFDLESDILKIKMNKMKYKMSTREIFRELSLLDGKYNWQVNLDPNTFQITGMELSIVANKINNVKIAITGDILVDNYKRGNVQLSEYITDLDVGNSKVRAIDSNIKIANSKVVLEMDKSLDEVYSEREKPNATFWFNEESELVAISDAFRFNPIDGINYVFTNNPSEHNDVVNYYVKNKYLINNSIKCIKASGGNYLVDLMVFHYQSDTNLNFYVRDDTNDTNLPELEMEIPIKGTYIYAAGIIFAPNTKFNPDETIYVMKTSRVARAAGPDNNEPVPETKDDYATEQYAFYLSEENIKDIKKMSKDYKTKRIYYAPIVYFINGYSGYTENPAGSTTKYNRSFLGSLYALRNGAIKYIDL